MNRFGLLLFCLSGSLVAAEERVLTPRDVADIKTVRSAAISPDGQSIAYVLSVPRTLFDQEDGPAWAELHLWDAEHGSRPFITGDVNIGDVSWTPDGKGIAFVAKRGDDKKSSLYVIPVDGGEARRVLTHENGIGQYHWAPDGKRVLFLAGEKEIKEKETLAKQGFDQEIFEEDMLPDLLWLADLSTDSPQTRQIPLPGTAEGALWSPDGAYIAVTVAPTSLVDDTYMNKWVQVLRAEGGETVKRIDTPGKLGDIRWSPDGKRLAMIAAADRNDPNPGRLWIADLGDGGIAKLFSEDEGDVRAFAWRDAENLFYLWDEGVYTSLCTIDLKTQARETLLSKEGPAFSNLDFGAGNLAMTAETPRHPAELFLWQTGQTQARRLTVSNPWLAEVSLAPQEVVTYPARDGLSLEGLLIRPLHEEQGKKYPVIVYVHGGPESHVRNGWLTSYSQPGQVAAARGFAVFYPNYRASTGRGVAFSKLDHGRPAMEEFDDLVDGVHHLSRGIGLADEQKAGITGGSYGGYATAWGATKLSEHFAAAVMFVGISNKISKQGVSDIPEEVVQVHDRRELWDDWQLFLEQSPIYHAENGRTPLLILHGKKDKRVPVSQGMELYRILKRLGKTPVRLVLYPNEAHGNRRAAARYDYHLRSLRWMEHYLLGEGGEPPPKDLDYGKDTAKADKKEIATN